MLVIYGFSRKQFGSQPSPGARLPSSHCSPDVTIPLPHDVGVQLASQPSPLFGLASSHISAPATMPLPQLVNVQFESQPSPLSRLPSSHCSVLLSGFPSPHVPAIPLVDELLVDAPPDVPPPLDMIPPLLDDEPLDDVPPLLDDVSEVPFGSPVPEESTDSSIHAAGERINEPAKANRTNLRAAQMDERIFAAYAGFSAASILEVAESALYARRGV